MVEKYLDKNGTPLREGFYKAGNVLLQIRYISRACSGWKCEHPDGHISRLNPNVPKHNFVPLNDTDAGEIAYELSKKARFIRSKLERLARADKAGREI